MSGLTLTEQQMVCGVTTLSDTDCLHATNTGRPMFSSQRGSKVNNFPDSCSSRLVVVLRFALTARIFQFAHKCLLGVECLQFAIRFSVEKDFQD